MITYFALDNSKNEIKAKILLSLKTSFISQIDKTQLEQELNNLDFENISDVSGFIGKIKKLNSELGNKIEQIIKAGTGTNKPESDGTENFNSSNINNSDVQLYQIFEKFSIGKILGTDAKQSFYTALLRWKKDESNNFNDNYDLSEQNKAIEVYNNSLGA